MYARMTRAYLFGISFIACLFGAGCSQKGTCVSHEGTLGASCVVNMSKEFCRAEFTSESSTLGVAHCNAKGYTNAAAGMKKDQPSVDIALEKGEMVHFTKPLGVR